MLGNLLPVLVSMHNVTICLEKILDKAQFDSVALIHLNTTVDFADKIYEQLSNDTDYAWMLFNMDNNATLENHLMKNNLQNNIFFVYALDHLKDWITIRNFIISTKLNHRQNQIYIVNHYPTLDLLQLFGNLTFHLQFFNFGVLFWNASGNGTGIEAYTFNGFLEKIIIQIPVVNDQCSNDIYDRIFFEKETNFYGYHLTLFGETEPPRIVRTRGMSNGQYEYSIGGHDVLIIDVVAKHLNATTKYKLLSEIMYMHDIKQYYWLESKLKLMCVTYRTNSLKFKISWNLFLKHN